MRGVGEVCLEQGAEIEVVRGCFLVPTLLSVSGLSVMVTTSISSSVESKSKTAMS